MENESKSFLPELVFLPPLKIHIYTIQKSTACVNLQTKKLKAESKKVKAFYGTDKIKL
jgi:hypothetical protein